MVTNITEASESNPVNDNDDVIDIRSPGHIPLSKNDQSITKSKYAGKNVNGYFLEGFKGVFISSDIIKNRPVLDENNKMVNGLNSEGKDSFERVLSHETGHRLGYNPHTNEAPRNLAIENNLMQSGDQKTRGIGLLSSQISEIIEEYRKGNLNSGTHEIEKLTE